MGSERKYEEYHLLAPEEGAVNELLPQTHGNLSSYWLSLRPLLPWRTFFAILAVLLLLIVSFTLGYEIRTIMGTTGISPYLNLGHTQADTLWWNTEYSSENATDTRLNELWDTHIPWESGIIALTNEEARAMDLPESQPFPWDASRKRIYIVNAHHILHCVRNIYISIQQYRTNTPQTINYPHILHCLDSLRVETICSADDTLRYVPLNSAHGFRPGDGQLRKCRNWSQVQEFVEAHDPCYRYLKPGDSKLSNLERFKFCPPDSEYIPKIRKYFGYGDDWTPQPQEGPRELEW
ncbi:hypothetical protein GL218_08634 [Daldinia childiae]|uniref:uncharacterized protein n=1 Tax=Daldinia childiae TaxID=326645 RepID=UPI00144810FF|nr:uncharacterized protein GL218_08634 [Daldinia childiae]KAF3067451.1 hypothetical protein GL218_08634 [Daldinia childiae]